jgi:hypothetical protein
MNRRGEPLVLEQHAVDISERLESFPRSGQGALDSRLRGDTRLMIDPVSIVEPFKSVITDDEQVRHINAFKHVIHGATGDDPGHVGAASCAVEGVPGTLVEDGLRRRWGDHAERSVKVREEARRPMLECIGTLPGGLFEMRFNGGVHVVPFHV